MSADAGGEWPPGTMIKGGSVMGQVATIGREGLAMVRDAAPRATYTRQVTQVLSVATLLSMAYTVYTALTLGTDDLRNPVAYIVYGIWWGLILLVRTDKRWAWWVVAVATGLMLLVGVFYYPTVFVPEQQTTLGWFENDLYMGLLLLAEYLCIQRLRGVVLGPKS
ncbi:MAG TPA: hypothetical protein VIL85_28200 [Thermomicrobiales bacterium]|jgi:hypothetical protein